MFTLGKGAEDKCEWRSVVGSHDCADAIRLAEIWNPVLWLNSHHRRTPEVYVQLVLHIRYQYPCNSSFYVNYFKTSADRMSLILSKNSLL